MMHHLRQMLAVLFLLVANSLYATSPQQECTQGCLIKIEGLQKAYSPGSQTNVSISNTSDQNLDINVALEGLENGSWTEIAGSVSKPSQSFSKILELKTVKAGTSFVFVFNPCETRVLVKTGDSLGHSDHPCLRSTEASAPTSLRLRVDVFKRPQGKVQRVRSQEFRLLPGN